jgi:inositol phosphorylceramide mannosyltransferase catalytic subunit
VAPVIPRLFHRVWVGDAPVPDEFEEYGRTWALHHPGWELRTWTEGSLPSWARPEALDQRRHPVERSDLLRYELLRLYGGVYVDMDFECLRPIEDLIQGLDFFVAENRPGRVGTAIMGSVPGHPILEAAVQRVRPQPGCGYDKDATGPPFFNDLLTEFPDAHRFEDGYFYRAGPRAYAVHHSARAWMTHHDMNAEIKKLKAKLRRARKQLATAERKQQKAEAQRDRALERAAMAEARLWPRLRRKLRRPAGAVRRSGEQRKA